MSRTRCAAGRVNASVSAAATASAAAASAVTAVAEPISGAEDPVAAPQQAAMPEAVVSAHSSRRPHLAATFGTPQTTVIPEGFACRGLLNGVLDEGGEIIGPEDRAGGPPRRRHGRRARSGVWVEGQGPLAGTVPSGTHHVDEGRVCAAPA
jgi:hypothetical protein